MKRGKEFHVIFDCGHEMVAGILKQVSHFIIWFHTEDYYKDWCGNVFKINWYN